MSEKLISIRRGLVAGDHQSLRDSIPRINHKLSELQPKWRRLGEAGLSLLERGEFQRAVEKPRSKLAKANPESLANVINSAIIPKMPTEHQPVTLDVTGTAFMGDGPYISIAYLLDPEQIHAERNRFTQLIDKMSGLNLFWKDHVTHVTVATIDKWNADDRVLDAFRGIAPVTLKFGLAQAVPS